MPIQTPTLGRWASLGLAFGLVLTALPAFADKPEWAGHGKHKEKHEYKEERDHGERRGDDGRYDASVSFSFGSDDRRIASEYYGERTRKGSCPPGLAKKHNGCMPPGQAKKWHKGQPLAKEVRYYEVPRELRVRLPAPPPNGRYVRVEGDILLMSGSGIVIDAMIDIVR